ncbi:MAG: D-alanyl-D-alanine carboxypeptidase family protein [Pseudomonadota bacterium]|nr:D-alanyl-D-alanine carboxypeptidase family protein [Pseudomonadota bacterium]
MNFARAGSCGQPVATLLVLLIAASLLVVPQPSRAGYSAHVVEANTGSILYSYKANTQNFPASLGKVMTLYLVFRGLDRGDFTLETKIKISHYAARQPPSKLGIPAGGSISVRNAILALATKSANDIASALAEFLMGTEREFAKTMTQQAKLLGMTNTTFRNASGLPHSQQKTTALDMTILGQALYEDFPHYSGFFAQRKFTFNGKTYRNHNSLLGVYKGVNGIKTGYIRASGYHLMISGVHNEHHLIAVVLGGKTARGRDNQMKRLLDRAYHSLDIKDKILDSIVLPPAKPKKAYKGQDFSENSNNGEKQMSRNDTGTVSEHPSTLPNDPHPNLGKWAVQLGAFSLAQSARSLLERTVASFPNELMNSAPEISPITTELGILYRAKHIGLSEKVAKDLCSKLNEKAQPCIVVEP